MHSGGGGEGAWRCQCDAASPTWQGDWVGPTSFPHEFAGTTVTNYHRLDGLKQQRPIPSPFWRPEVQHQLHGPKSRCWQGHAPPRGSGGGVVPHSPLLVAPAGHLCLWPHSSSLGLCGHSAFPAMCNLLPLSTEDMWDSIKGSPNNPGSSPHVKVLPFITSTKTLLPFTGSRDEDPEIFGSHHSGYYTSKEENEKVT